MGGSARRLTIVAGLFGLAVVLKLVSMTQAVQDTAADWVTVALFGAAAVAALVNAVSMRRARSRRCDEQYR